MQKAVLTLSLLTCGLALPASADDSPVNIWFAKTPAETSDAIALMCANRSSSITEQDDRHVECVKPASGVGGILGQALLGNSRSTPLMIHARFTILRDGKSTRVLASQWAETQMAFGQVRRTPLSSAKQKAALAELLIAIGGHNVPPEYLDPAPPPSPTPESPPGL